MARMNCPTIVRVYTWVSTGPQCLDGVYARNGRTVSILAEYMELADHLRSNSKFSTVLTFSSSKRLEQKDFL